MYCSLLRKRKVGSKVYSQGCHKVKKFDVAPVKTIFAYCPPNELRFWAIMAKCLDCSHQSNQLPYTASILTVLIKDFGNIMFATVTFLYIS